MFRVTYPFNEILHSVMALLVIQNGFNFKFRMVIDGDGRGWWRWDVPVWGFSWVSVWSQEGDMEYWMDLEGIW